MARLPHIVRKRKKYKIMGKPDVISHQDIAAMQVDARLDLIRALIPVRVPRLRDGDGEVPLSCYEYLHHGGDLNDHVFRQVLYGISCRNYEQAAEQIPGAIGLSSSTVSRQFVEASAKKLREFQERDLSDLDLVAVFLDGKSFADDQMVIAVGVDLKGHKHLLGFVQTSTENKRSISQFLKSLVNRGLDVSDGLLAVIDGAKGLRAALLDAFTGQVLIQRCQWHKRENLVSYLAKSDQKYWRSRLQKAYQRPTYKEASRELNKIRQELSNINEFAVASLDEGLEETLTLHRLGMFGLLGRSLKTTNIIESINAQAEERCGFRHLPALRAATMKKLDIRKEEWSEEFAA